MNTFSVKFDHQLNANNLLNERVFYGSNYQSAPAGNSGEIIPPNGPIDMFNSVGDPTIAALVGVVWNSTLSNRTLLETRFGFNLFSQTLEPNNKIDPQDARHQHRPARRRRSRRARRHHAVRPHRRRRRLSDHHRADDDDAGVDGADAHARPAHVQDRRQLGLRLQPQRAEPGAHARSPPTGRRSGDVDALVGLLLARFEIAARSFGQTERHMSQTSVGVFINDDWKVTSRLTLSAGLRYEVFTPVNEQDNLATNFFPDRGLVQLGSNGLDQLYNAGQEQLRTARRPGLGRDGRRPNQRARRLRADLRRAADGHRPPRTLLDADAGRIPRLALADAAIRARTARRRHVPRSQQLDRRRRLRLPAAWRAGLRLVADRRAAVQHLPGAGRLPAGPVPLLPPHVPARDAAATTP